MGGSGHSDGGAGGAKKSSTGSDSSTSEASTIESSPKGDELTLGVFVEAEWGVGNGVCADVVVAVEGAGRGEPGSTTVRWQ